MTETKMPLSKPEDLSSEDLAKARGGLTSRKAPAPGQPGAADTKVKPFVVDGPYT